MRFRFLVFALLATGCADFRRGPEADAAAIAAPVDDPMFEQDIHPLLVKYCLMCHTRGKEAAFTQFVLTGNAKQDRAGVLKLISPGYPPGSLLLRKAVGESHTGGQRISMGGEDYQLISSWIAIQATPP